MQTLKARLDRGKKLPFPDGILINGRGPNGVSFNVEQGIQFSPSNLSVNKKQRIILIHDLFCYVVYHSCPQQERLIGLEYQTWGCNTPLTLESRTTK